jgi:uncharacterized protein (TIRG00374 family)
VLKFLFLIIGLIALVGIVLHIGLESILQAASQLGPLPLVIILLPMIVVYGLEAWGWRLTLGAYAGKVGFLRLFAIRMAGETVNVTTPAAYMGGEPLKAYWLKRYGVPMVESMASVITAKTTMTLAQVLFILLGLGLAFWIIDAASHYWMAMLVSLGLLAFGVGLFVVFQRYGLGMGSLILLRTCLFPKSPDVLRGLGNVFPGLALRNAGSLCDFVLSGCECRCLDIYFDCGAHGLY